MGKEFLGVRIESKLKDKLDKVADDNSETVTETVQRALSLFLQGSTDKPDIYDVDKRLRALESKFTYQPEPTFHKEPENSSKVKIQPKVKIPDKVNVQELGELITKKEAAAITGYAVNTFSRTFSQRKIYKVDKRGKAGLYKKSEILDKIGIKEGHSL